MPVALIQKDPFSEAEQLQAKIDMGDSENFNVRRPLYGMSVKDPRFAYISLSQALGDGHNPTPISLIDSSAPGGTSHANHNFILQSVQEARQEKVQVIETFGDTFSFFYGQKPIVLAVQGALLNSEDFNWKNEFLANYDRYLRGTKCVENRTRVFLGWDDVLAQGYLLNLSLAYTSEQPFVIPINFSMLLTKPPLDLSNAAAPMDAPKVGDPMPWTYRSLGAFADPESPFFNPSELLPEYMGEKGGQLMQRELVTIGEDGMPKVVSGSDSDALASSDGGTNSAPWIAGPAPGSKQWNDASESLLKMNGYLTSQQKGADLVTTIQALRRNPTAFQFANRDAAVLRFVESLGRGVSNSAAVVPDAPDVE